MPHFPCQFTKKPLVVLCSAVLLLLAACAPAPSSSEANHLLLYDQFDAYNSNEQNQFHISEVDVDGALCYQLKNEEHGVVIQVLPGDEIGVPAAAAVRYQDKSLEFEMPTFVLGSGNASGVATLMLEDLTEDGIADLVYLHGGGGTGVWEDHVQVFDLAAMEACPVSEDYSLLEDSFQARHVQTDTAPNGGYLPVFEIVALNGAVQYAGMEHSLSEPPADLSVGIGGYRTLNVQDGKLRLTSAFAVYSHNAPSYLGEITGAFVYDPAEKAFTLQPPFSLEVYQPVTPDP